LPFQDPLERETDKAAGKTAHELQDINKQKCFVHISHTARSLRWEIDDRQQMQSNNHRHVAFV